MGLELEHLFGGTQFHGHCAGCGMRAILQGQALPIRHTPVPSQGRQLQREPPAQNKGHEHVAPTATNPLVWKEDPGSRKACRGRKENSGLSVPSLHTGGWEGGPPPTLLQTAWCRHLLDGRGSAWVGTFQKKLLAVRSSHLGPRHCH